MSLQLDLTEAQLNGLWQVLHGARKSAKTVTVDRQALERLLLDHTRALGAAEKRVTIVKAPPETTPFPLPPKPGPGRRSPASDPRTRGALL